MTALNPEALAPKLASARAFIRGVKRKRASALSKLCYAAVHAALAQRSDASFAASCAALAELCAAGTTSPGPAVESKAAVMALVDQSALADLFCQGEGSELQGTFSALHSHLGWSPQQAAAALLDLGLRQTQPAAGAAVGGASSAAAELCAGREAAVLKGQAARAALLRTSGQHIQAVAALLRERGVEGSQLAHLTQLSCTHWTTASTADAQAALQALEAAHLQPHLAAVLWLSCGSATIDPAFLDTVRQMREAGVPAQQVELFAAMFVSAPHSTNPRKFTGSMAVLHALLGGDWRAAADAAAEQPRLLQLVEQPSAGQIASFQELAQAGLDPEQRVALVSAALEHGRLSRLTIESGLAAATLLSTLLGSWRAAVEAVLADRSLLNIPNDAAMQRVVAGLSTAGLEQSQLLRLAKAAALSTYHARMFTAVAEQLYGGDWRAAALQFLQDQSLQHSASLDRLQLALNILQRLGAEVANDRGRQRVLQYVKGDLPGAQAWRVTVPAGTPAEQRRAAAEAAPEAEGFRASGGRTESILSQLAAGTVSGFQMSGADFVTWM